MVMSTNPEGIDLVKRFEGCRLEAYLCPADIWTIGYGHTGDDVYPGLTITEEQADALLRKDMQHFETAVARLIMVPINANEFSALVSLTFNIGEGNFSHSSCLRFLNQGDRMEAANRIELWNKARVNGQLTVLEGLVRRRAAEKALFLTPDASTSMMAVPTMDVPPEADEREVDARGARTLSYHPDTDDIDVEQIVQDRLVQIEMERLSKTTDDKIAVGAGVSGTAATVSVARNVIEALAPDLETARDRGGSALMWLKEISAGAPEWFLMGLKIIIIAGILYIFWQLWRRGHIQALAVRIISDEAVQQAARDATLQALRRRGARKID